MNNGDGGPGGTTGIAPRYLRQCNGGTGILGVNGAEQFVIVLRRFLGN